VCNILREDVIVRKDAGVAHSNLLRLPGITKYVRSLRTQDEREHFERHLRKYVNMYLPECPFEVCTTNRYTILTHEACVVARRPISPGESIKFLTGIQVEMTEKEEEELSSRTDFSIVISSRRKRPSLFLGPARFANHDCDSNARLSTSGPHGINIVARKHIQTGDEITVQYGDNYFGEDNCECLCASCEKAVRNGWDPKGPVLPDSDSDDSSDEEEERKLSRKSSAKPKQEPVAKATGALKRKRDQSTPAEGSGGPGLPRKRGRWTSRAKNGNKFTSGAQAKGTVQASQKMMADWFAKRAQGELELDKEEDEEEKEEEGREEEKEDAEDEDEETLDDLHEQFQIKKRPTQGQQPQKRHSKKQNLFGKMFGFITGAATRSISKLEAEIREMNEQTATLMHIDVADVPSHYRGAEPMMTQAQVDLMKGKLHSPSESPKHDDTTLVDWDCTSVEASPGKSGRRPDAKKAPSSSPEVHKSDKSARVTDRFAQAKQSSTSWEKGRSKSNLRNVLNADDDDNDEIDIYEVPESPPPEEASKRLRGRARKNLPRHDSNQRIDATQNSTDSSSISSVFSTEGAAGEASSLSSTEQSPDRLDGFSAGRICQNIVEMYTTETSPVNDDWEEERKLSNARLDGWSRGRLPTRKSSRRTLLAPPSQAVTSIEPATQTKEDDEDEDEDDCKRGPVRTPGDFHLTVALLSTPLHRWVECRNCDEFFVQAESYLTRIACPRCERHSKLYGYYWPKTDREGKHDTEERVLDHRTIHRFIDPEDERMEKKGKKGLAEVIRDRETSSRLQSEALSDSRFDRLRNSPRRSESRRKTRSSMA
jgi:histone-lysine N-methyltransferase SUV420H